MSENHTHTLRRNQLMFKGGMELLRALALTKSLMTLSKFICRKMSCSMLIRSCVIVVHNLSLVNFSLLDDLSPVQLLITSTWYNRRAVSALKKSRAHLSLLSTSRKHCAPEMFPGLLFSNSYVNSANWTNSFSRDQSKSSLYMMTGFPHAFLIWTGVIRSFPKQNIVMNSGILFTDVELANF